MLGKKRARLGAASLYHNNAYNANLLPQHWRVYSYWFEKSRAGRDTRSSATSTFDSQSIDEKGDLHRCEYMYFVPGIKNDMLLLRDDMSDDVEATA